MKMYLMAGTLVLLSLPLGAKANGWDPFWYGSDRQTPADPNRDSHEATYAQTRAVTPGAAPTPVNGEEWTTDIHADSCPALQDYAYAFENEPDTATGYHTDAVVIVKGGKIVAETYSAARGYSREARHLSWSMAKSFTNALVGYACALTF